MAEPRVNKGVAISAPENPCTYKTEMPGVLPITTDSSGNVYVGIITELFGFTGDCSQNTLTRVASIKKYTSSGQLLWTRDLGDLQSDSQDGQGQILVANGTVYFGFTKSFGTDKAQLTSCTRNNQV